MLIADDTCMRSFVFESSDSRSEPVDPTDDGDGDDDDDDAGGGDDDDDAMLQPV